MINGYAKNELFALILDLGNEVESIKKTKLVVGFKEDHSPLTEADTLVNAQLNNFFINTIIKNVISEENAEIH